MVIKQLIKISYIKVSKISILKSLTFLDYDNLICYFNYLGEVVKNAGP